MMQRADCGGGGGIELCDGLTDYALTRIHIHPSTYLPVVQRQQLRGGVAAGAEAAEARDGVDVHDGRGGQAGQGRGPHELLHGPERAAAEVGPEAPPEGGPVGPVGGGVVLGWVGGR